MAPLNPNGEAAAELKTNADFKVTIIGSGPAGKLQNFREAAEDVEPLEASGRLPIAANRFGAPRRAVADSVYTLQDTLPLSTLLAPTSTRCKSLRNRISRARGRRCRASL